MSFRYVDDFLSKTFPILYPLLENMTKPKPNRFRVAGAFNNRLRSGERGNKNGKILSTQSLNAPPPRQQSNNFLSLLLHSNWMGICKLCPPSSYAPEWITFIIQFALVKMGDCKKLCPNSRNEVSNQRICLVIVSKIIGVGLMTSKLTTRFFQYLNFLVYILDCFLPFYVWFMSFGQGVDCRNWC